MAYHPLLALLRPQIGMLVEKVRDLGLDCLGEQGTGSVAQEIGYLRDRLSPSRRPDEVYFASDPGGALCLGRLRGARFLASSLSDGVSLSAFSRVMDQF